MNRTKILLLVGAGTVGLFATVNALGLWAASVDDAYISLRYAWNLVQGEGLVWNPGERVEGFSNPVFTLLCALPIALGMDGLLGAKLIGLLGLLAMVAGVVGAAWELVEPEEPDEVLALVLGSGVLAFSLPAITWATAGLEGTQYAGTLALAMWLLLREERLGGPPLSALFAGLAAISRPEAPLLVLGLVLWRGWHAWRSRQLPWKWAAAFALPTFGYLLFRLAYYGALLPNTTWRKVHRGWDFATFWAYVGDWVLLEWPLLFVGLAGLVLLNRRGLVVAWTVAAQALFLYGVGTDWMEGWRFVLPAIPGLAIGVAAGGVLLARRSRHAQLGLVAVLAVLGVNTLGVEQDRGLQVVDRAEHHRLPEAMRVSWEGSMSYAVPVLALHAPPGATVAYTEIGIVGYASDWRVLDLAGLTSREVAGATGLELPEVATYVGEQRPELIVLKKRGWELLPLLREQDWLARDYELIEEPDAAALEIWRRKDVAAPSPQQQLQTLATAVERAPRFKLLHQRRVRLANKYKEHAALEAACADQARYRPELELEPCQQRPPKSAQTGLVSSAQAAPLPPPEELPELEWVVNGPGEPEVAPELIALGPGERNYTVCEAGRPSVSGPVRVVGEVRSEEVGRERMGAQVQLRWFDAGGGFLDGTITVIHQGRGDQDWSRVDELVQPPEGAAKVRLCLEFGAESGRFEARSLARI